MSWYNNRFILAKEIFLENCRYCILLIVGYIITFLFGWVTYNDYSLVIKFTRIVLMDWATPYRATLIYCFMCICIIRQRDYDYDNLSPLGLSMPKIALLIFLKAAIDSFILSNHAFIIYGLIQC